jgi:LCP family protein required for cell wall assembly
VGAIAAKQELDRPLGPTLALALPTSTPIPTEAATAVPIQGAAVPTPIGLEVWPTPAPRPICGGPGRLLVLLVGADNREGYVYGLADAIRVVRVDFVEPSVSVFAFPRDLWVTIPGLEGRGITHGKINQAYFYGNAYRLPGLGPTLLAQTLVENFGLRVDRYVAANEGAFIRAIDALGGVDVEVPEPVARFRIGRYHMSGIVALEYASIRKPDSDWRRIDRQSHVLQALKDRLRDPRALAALPDLVDIFSDEVLTDLSKAEIASLLCLAGKLDGQAVIFTGVSPEHVTPSWSPGGMWIMVPEKGEMSESVDEFSLGSATP